MRISYWSSYLFSSDLLVSHAPERLLPTIRSRCRQLRLTTLDDAAMTSALKAALPDADEAEIASLRKVGEGSPGRAIAYRGLDIGALDGAMRDLAAKGRSEEHTSELQSLMSISYAVFCLKKKNKTTTEHDA